MGSLRARLSASAACSSIGDLDAPVMLAAAIRKTRATRPFAKWLLPEWPAAKAYREPCQEGFCGLAPEALRLFVEALLKGLIVLGAWAMLHDAVPFVRGRRGAKFGVLVIDKAVGPGGE